MVGGQSGGKAEGTWSGRKEAAVTDTKVNLCGLFGLYGKSTKLFYPSLYAHFILKIIL